MGDQLADSELIATWAASETIPDIAVGLAGLKAWEAERAAQQNAYYDSELRAVRDSITSTGAEVSISRVLRRQGEEQVRVRMLVGSANQLVPLPVGYKKHLP